MWPGEAEEASFTVRPSSVRSASSRSILNPEQQHTGVSRSLTGPRKRSTRDRRSPAGPRGPGLPQHHTVMEARPQRRTKAVSAPGSEVGEGQAGLALPSLPACRLLSARLSGPQSCAGASKPVLLARYPSSAVGAALGSRLASGCWRSRSGIACRRVRGLPRLPRLGASLGGRNRQGPLPRPRSPAAPCCRVVWCLPSHGRSWSHAFTCHQSRHAGTWGEEGAWGLNSRAWAWVAAPSLSTWRISSGHR